MFFFVTEEREAARRIIREVLSPTLNRPEEELSERLLVGPAEECAQKLAAYQAAGAQRIFLWPVEDELRQLAIFRERVADMQSTRRFDSPPKIARSLADLPRMLNSRTS